MPSARAITAMHVKPGFRITPAKHDEDLDRLLNPKDRALVAMQFLGLFNASVGVSRRKGGLVRIDATPLELILKQRQMGCDLASQFPLRTPTKKEILELSESSSQCSHHYQARHLTPALRLFFQGFLSGFGNGVVFRFTILLGLTPRTLNPALLFQPHQGRVEGSLVEAEQVLRELLQARRDGVSVLRTHALKRTQNNQIERPPAKPGFAASEQYSRPPLVCQVKSSC